ncbi:hypothetical protein BC826DRAFT_71072 [Russula brevipes]|nr:hypothetical protein BC826DRAFT_71072 [Russula brevipes]
MGMSSLLSNVGKNRKPRKEAHSGNDTWPSARPLGECECTNGAQMLTIPSPGRAPSHGALDSGPGPLGDTMTSSRGGSSSRPRIATLSRVTRRASVERLVQATTVRSAAPLTFASGSESCPRPLGPKFVGFAPQVFRVRASDHLSSPSDDSRFPRANGGERRAANTTRTAACAMQPAATRTTRRPPRSQRNANGGVRHAASAT